MPIERVQTTANNLLDALSTREQTVIQKAQQEFSQAVEEAWWEYEAGKLDVYGRQTLPRSLYLYATRELPQEVTYLRRWSMVEREIRKFLRTVKLIRPTRKK